MEVPCEAHVALLATDGSLGSVTDFGSEADSPSRWVSSGFTQSPVGFWNGQESVAILHLHYIIETKKM